MLKLKRCDIDLNKIKIELNYDTALRDLKLNQKKIRPSLKNSKVKFTLLKKCKLSS